MYNELELKYLFHIGQHNQKTYPFSKRGEIQKKVEDENKEDDITKYLLIIKNTYGAENDTYIGKIYYRQAEYMRSQKRVQESYNLYEKSIYFNYKQDQMLQHSFDYLKLLLPNKDLDNEERDKDDKSESIVDRIISVGKFLNNMYDGTLELFHFYADYKKDKLPAEEQKRQRDIIMMDNLTSKYNGDYKDWSFKYGYLIKDYKKVYMHEYKDLLS